MKLGSILLPSFFIIFIEADFPPASVFGPFPQLTRYSKLTFRQLLCLAPQLAMSVETEDPISLCWAPQLAMSVETEDPISLCWARFPNLHRL